MDKKSLRILKMFIKRHYLSCRDISILCNTSSLIIADFVFELFSNELIRTDANIKSGDPIGLDTVFSITPKGLSAIEDIRRNNRRFRIPVIISIIALILSILSIIFQIIELRSPVSVI